MTEELDEIFDLLTDKQKDLLIQYATDLLLKEGEHIP